MSFLYNLKEHKYWNPFHIFTGAHVTVATKPSKKVQFRTSLFFERADAEQIAKTHKSHRNDDIHGKCYSFRPPSQSGVEQMASL